MLPPDASELTEFYTSFGILIRSIESIMVYTLETEEPDLFVMLRGCDFFTVSLLLWRMAGSGLSSQGLRSV